MLVHGSVVGGRATWAAQRPLADALRARRARTARVPAESTGRPGRLRAGRGARRRTCSAPATTSSGTRTAASISLLAAAVRPERVWSLTVIEPPATRVARGDPAVAAFAAAGVELYAIRPDGRAGGVPPAVPRGRRLRFDPPSPLPPELEQGARTLIVERGPWEAEIPLDALAAAPFPKLVVSGRTIAAFDADLRRARARARRRARSCFRATATPSSATRIQRTRWPTSSSAAAQAAWHSCAAA